MERLDNSVLVIVELALDASPEFGHLGVRDGSVADHVEQRPDALANQLAVPDVQSYRALRVWLLDNREEPRPLADRLLAGVTAQAKVPERSQKATLRAEREIYRPRGHASCGSHRRDGGPDVAVLLE